MGEISNEENISRNGTDSGEAVKIVKKPWRILIILVIIAAGLAALFFYLDREYKLTGVTVSGCSYYTEDEIKEKLVAGILKDNTLGLYLLNRIREPSIPFVEKVDMEMVNHHELLISIYEKSMIACIPYMNEYLYFDKDGIIIENSAKKMDWVPVVEGIQFGTMNLHEKLEVEDDDIFDKILNLSQLLKQYSIKTKKVYFNYQSEVILYTGNIKVLLGNSDRYDDKIAELSNIIKKAKNRKLKGTLDMRSFESGQSEIIFKEEEI